LLLIHVKIGRRVLSAALAGVELMDMTPIYQLTADVRAGIKRHYPSWEVIISLSEEWNSAAGVLEGDGMGQDEAGAVTHTLSTVLGSLGLGHALAEPPHLPV